MFENPSSDLVNVFNSIERLLIELIEILMETRDALVVKIILACVLSRDVILANGFTFKRYSRIYFPSENMDLFSGNDTRDFLIDTSAYIMNDIRSFLMNASGWVLEKCESVQFQCSTLSLFQSARVGSYLKFPFPGRRGVFNFKVKSQCVEWSITAGYFYEQAKAENAKLQVKERKDLRFLTAWAPHKQKLKLGMFTSGLDFYEALTECEMQNSVNINVFSHRNTSVILVRKSREKFGKKINLFLIHDSVDPKLATKQHMSVIYDFNKFMFQTKTHKGKAQFCQLCFRRFGSPQTLNEHLEFCKENIKAKQKTPKQGTFIEFDSWHSRLPYPYICTYSIQYYSVPVTASKGSTQFKRIPSAFSICVFKNVGKEIELLYTHYVDSGDLVKRFWESVGEISHDILVRVRTNASKIVMTPEDKIRHEQATKCDLCSKDFTVEDRSPSDGPPPAKKPKRIIKMADHDHSNSETPNYRYTLCGACNSRLKMKQEAVFINFNESSADN